MNVLRNYEENHRILLSTKKPNLWAVSLKSLSFIGEPNTGMTNQPWQTKVVEFQL